MPARQCVFDLVTDLLACLEGRQQVCSMVLALSMMKELLLVLLVWVNSDLGCLDDVWLLGEFNRR